MDPCASQNDTHALPIGCGARYLFMQSGSLELGQHKDVRCSSGALPGGHNAAGLRTPCDHHSVMDQRHDCTSVAKLTMIIVSGMGDEQSVCELFSTPNRQNAVKAPLAAIVYAAWGHNAAGLRILFPGPKPCLYLRCEVYKGTPLELCPPLAMIRDRHTTQSWRWCSGRLLPIAQCTTYSKSLQAHNQIH